MSTSRDDELANEPKVTDLIGALRALSTCLRHLACGYGRDPRERTAALALLAGRIPGVAAADLDVTRKSVARPAASAVDVEKGLASYPSGSLNVPRPSGNQSSSRSPGTQCPRTYLELP